MSNTAKIAIIGAIVVILGILGIAGIGVAQYISMSNRNARLTNLFEAKQVESKTIHSEMWQTVKEIGDVHGDVSTMSGDIEIQGSAHNAKSMSCDIDIGGSLNGNARTMSGDIKHR